jgi:hypothetical protein
MKPMPADQWFYAEALRRKAITRQTWISVWDSTVKGSLPDNDVFKKNANYFATLLRSTVYQILKGEGRLKFEKNK